MCVSCRFPISSVWQHPELVMVTRRLVGIARLEPTKDMLLDKFLRLPSDCKALMSAQFAFNPSEERTDAA